MYQSLLKNSAAPTLLFLHGWGATWQSLFPILQGLGGKYNLYAIDLPYPKDKVLTLDDYCQFVLNFIKKEHLQKPVLVGHSLGGAIASKIAIDHPEAITSIVLCAAASIRHQLPIHWRLLQAISTPFKPLIKPIRHLIYRHLPLNASDYQVLSTPIEKSTFQNLIKADLTPYLPQICLPTLILWGDNDLSTPLSDGLMIHSLIPNSIFLSFPNTGHFFYLDYPDKTITAITSFVDNDTH
jgi:pimeloyl-ACP methyl ester carboxylesterase